MSVKDQLYLLRPGFMNAGIGPLYCSDSAPVEGVLSFFPNLRKLIDVHYIEFPRPRAVLVEALGEEYQAVPVLIIAPGRTLRKEMPEVKSALPAEDEAKRRQSANELIEVMRTYLK